MIACVFLNRNTGHFKVVSLTTLKIVLEGLHDKGPWPGIYTSDHDIVVASDSAIHIMDGTPNGVGLLINYIITHFDVCK